MTAPVHGHNSHEVQLQPEELIITKTDAAGHITYANRVFTRIAEYPEYELLGKAHNLIRHPDMPRGVFRLMWKTLQAGQEFFGFIKNYTASGNYYWVFANVTPDYGHDRKLAGYYSVRRQPARAAVEKIIPIYEQMRKIEAKENKVSAPDVSMNWLLEEVKKHDAGYERFVLKINGNLHRHQGGVK